MWMDAAINEQGKLAPYRTSPWTPTRNIARSNDAPNTTETVQLPLIRR